MDYEDNIYGRIKIGEPVLLKLLESPSVLRLKKISQFGVPDKYYPFKNYTRYEHSVGVMILLKKLGATLEEQIAGLLHDVSCLTFSHVADWVFSKGREGIEDFHDTIHEQFVKKTDIPKILDNFNISIAKILKKENFTLLEREIPNLCADRVDYGLREFKYWLNPKADIGDYIKSLVNFNEEIVFNNRKNAFDFAVNFLELQNKHWGDNDAMIRYYFFSKALKDALEKNIISKTDFFMEENLILAKVENCQDKSIYKTLEILQKQNLRGFARESGKKIIKKFRYVDPKVISNGKLIKLSKIDSRLRILINKHKKINKKGLFV